MTPDVMPGSKAWEIQRRISADLTIRHLEALAKKFIPERPTDAGELRRRCLDLAGDLRRVFHRDMPAASVAGEEEEKP